MNERAPDTEADDLPTRATPADAPSRLVAEIIVAEEGPAECTIFPPDAADDKCLTTWITAQQGSFMSIETMR